MNFRSLFEWSGVEWSRVSQFLVSHQHRYEIVDLFGLLWFLVVLHKPEKIKYMSIERAVLPLD